MNVPKQTLDIKSIGDIDSGGLSIAFNNASGDHSGSPEPIQ